MERRKKERGRSETEKKKRKIEQRKKYERE